MKQTEKKMSDFRPDQAIYLQLAERICDDILSGRYRTGDRIPSVRELAETLEVNTNTVVRAYDRLTREDIIQTRRGMGYFVCGDARDRIAAGRRKAFLEERLPELFRQMRQLEIPMETVCRIWEEEQSGNGE